MQKEIHYLGDFDGAIDGHVTVEFMAEGSEYPIEGILRKPEPRFDPHITYFVQESDNPRAFLWPIDENATVYRGPGKQEMVGVVIVEYSPAQQPVHLD